MTENNPLLDTELTRRLNTLKSDISRETTEIKAAHVSTDSDHGTGKAMGIGMRATSELVASVLVGTLIGWQIDGWFATSPIFLLIFLLLGVASGFWNVYRIAKQSTGLQKKS